MSRTIVVLSCITIFATLLIGCGPKIENGAGKALENAGSVFKSGEEKFWMDSPATPTPAPPSNKKAW